MNATLTKELDKLNPEEKFILLDDMWTKKHPDFCHKPANSIYDFINNPFYLGLKGQVWESVQQDLVDYYKSGKREFWLEESIGAGKSFKASIIATYEVHKLLCLKNPQRLFNLSNSSKITILNMSTSETQAYDIVFGEIQGKIDNSYWFQKYTKYDNELKSRYAFDKNIFIIPGNSKETTPLGYSIIDALLDEANFFIDNAMRDNADEIYNAMQRRIFSRFGKYGRLGVISSPNHENDFISRKKKNGIPPDVFYRNRSLWEAKKEEYVNQKFVEVEPNYSIPESLVGEYNKNPDKFKRDLGAIAIGGEELYLKDRKAIIESMRLSNGWSGEHIENSYKSKGVAYYGHIDLAKNKCACGVALAHREGEDVVEDFLARIQAQPGGEINIEQVLDIIFALKRRGFELKKVTFDGWQSLSSIQRFKAKGIPSEELSMDRTLEPYDTLKEMMYSGHYKCVADPHLEREFRALQLIKGSKVDHPKCGSKDVSDASAGAVFNCVEGENMAEVNQQYAKEFVDRVHVIKIKKDDLKIGVRRFVSFIPELNGNSVILWAAADKEGFLYFYREAIVPRSTMEAVKETIDSCEIEESIEDRLIISQKITEDVEQGYSLIDQLSDMDLDFTEIEYKEDLASITLREGLRFDREKPISVMNRPCVYFSPECPETIKAIKFYMNKKNFDNNPVYEVLHKAVGIMVLAEPSW